jgi:hypothetical protein
MSIREYLKRTLFPKEMPRLMVIINILTALLLTISVILIVVQAALYIYPDDPWWSLHNIWPNPGAIFWPGRFEYIKYKLIDEYIWRIGLVGLTMFVVVNLVALKRAIKQQLPWRTYYAWSVIHVVLLILLIHAVVATSVPIE